MTTDPRTDIGAVVDEPGDGQPERVPTQSELLAAATPPHLARETVEPTWGEQQVIAGLRGGTAHPLLQKGAANLIERLIRGRDANHADPDVSADNQRLRAERDNATHQQQAFQNQVAALMREVQRLQHAERRASRHAILRDKEVAEADAKVAARDAEIARFNAREAALRLELHDAKTDIEDLRSRLKATSDACNDALNRLHTKTEVARGNRRHVAVLTTLMEQVAELGLNEDGTHKDPAMVVYVGDLRRAIEAPVEIPGEGEASPTARHCATCSCIHEHCGYVISSPGCIAECGQP